MKIVLQGNAEFFAENITFEGNHHIEVPEGFRFIAYQEGRKVRYHREKIESPSWFWAYSFGTDNEITLQKDLFKKLQVDT